MCGIAGLMTADGSSVPVAILDRLAKALAHRGPDGTGRVLEDDVGLIQTRLAIIDLETGDQPIRPAGEAPIGSPVLMANAEIYNYIELRQTMGDVTFATASDCEPPLHLYRRHGLDFADHLRGMYAIAIYDPPRRRLVLSRDPFGIKPLYIAETASGFAFASEPQALIAAGLVEPAMRPEKRDELLQLQFTSGRETPFAGIERLLPGETIAIEAGRIVERRRRAALPTEGPRPQDTDGALDRLDGILTDSVGVHQRSDVPYGMFLSGGVDSSVILALMARLNERPVRAFTVGFPGTQAADEREQARAAAAAVGADHVEVEFGEEDFWSLLPAAAAAMDDPAADYAVLPTYKLAQAARADDLKVILSGEGGDEMFAGYGRYRRALRSRLFGGRRPWRQGIFDGLDVLRGDATATTAWRTGIAAAEAGEAAPVRTPLQQAQAVDCAAWLPNDLLTKLDRCLMANGVEGRVPFLDPLVADFAVTLPDRLKVRRRLGKWLLRRWLETGLPAARPFARKQGFTVPVGAWMAGRGRQIGPLVAAQPGVAEACRPEAVERLFAGAGDRAQKAAWTLLFFALWHQCHILGQAPAGDAFESLASAA
jgi:asparagine synthase (glutamine-hydrolysing)